MEIILEFMYTGNLNFHKDKLADIIIACDRLKMTDTKEMCLAEVPNVLKHSNVFAWLDLACSLKLDNIKCKCEELIVFEFEYMPIMNEFLKFDCAKVKSVLKGIYDNDNIKKGDSVLLAAMRWVSHDPDSRLQDMMDLLSLIHLKKCSVQTINEVMESYNQHNGRKPQVCVSLSNTLADLSTTSLTKSKPTSSLLVIGGHRTKTIGSQKVKEVSPICWSIDPSNQTTSVFSAIPLAWFGYKHSICRTPGGFIVTGGEFNDECIMYTAASNSWLKLPSMLSLGWAHASVFVNGVLFILGGVTDNGQMRDRVEYMAIENGKWKCAPNIPIAVKFAKTAAIDGNIYLLNDFINSPFLELNAANKIWRDLAVIPVGFYESGVYGGFSMATVQDMIFVAGGYDMICASYSPITDDWCLRRPPNHLHLYGALVPHNNKLLLLGGSFSNGTSQVEEYDIYENKWSTVE